MRPAVAYIRVSKPKQGRSGLGLEKRSKLLSKRSARSTATRSKPNIVEVETGKGADALIRRPELAAAMKAARKARQGRQSRCRAGYHRQAGSAKPRRSFHQRPMVQRVPFIVTELGPDVDPFMLHIHAAVCREGT